MEEEEEEQFYIGLSRTVVWATQELISNRIAPTHVQHVMKYGGQARPPCVTQARQQHKPSWQAGNKNNDLLTVDIRRSLPRHKHLLKTVQRSTNAPANNLANKCGMIHVLPDGF